MLHEDTKRDLAFLKVASSLPPIDVAPSYAFLKGEDITVIGNPGLGDEIVLENAISRGVMSSRATLDGMPYLQINMAINPGNSGGPVFDSSGRVIGVATLKSTRAEAMAFSIPVEDLNAAIAQLDMPHPESASRHRAQVAFKLLTVAGTLYGVGIDIRGALLRRATPGSRPNLLPNEPVQKLDELLKKLDEEVLSMIEDEVAQIRNDPTLSKAIRGRYQDLTAGYKSMRALYASTRRPAAEYSNQVKHLRSSFLREIQAHAEGRRGRDPGAAPGRPQTDGQRQPTSGRDHTDRAEPDSVANHPGPAPGTASDRSAGAEGGQVGPGPHPGSPRPPQPEARSLTLALSEQTLKRRVSPATPAAPSSGPPWRSRPG